MTLSLDETLAASGLSASDLEDVERFVQTVEQPARFREVFRLLAEQGPFPARALQRHPRDLEHIVRHEGVTRDVDDLLDDLRTLWAEELARALPNSDRQAILWKVLREYKRRESLRIFFREVAGATSVRQTCAEIAALAEASLEFALQKCAELAGRPELAQHLCVLGMGKLGGRELNFSSDVDLIFVCSDCVADEHEVREAINHLARELTATMERNTPDGYVFRVDLRLRPEGSRGPLVQPAGPMIAYYRDWGRTWERSAMLKARAVAGNREVGEEVLSGLEPFIYRRYLDFDAIDELRAMKDKINQNAQLADIIGTSEEAAPAPVEREQPRSPLSQRLKRKMRGMSRAPRRSRPSVSAPQPQRSDLERDEAGVLGWDVKIGIGGIREIEFFVQALQLVHCGTRPTLRVRNTLEALDRLLYAGLMTHEDHTTMADAYDFLRRLEHRVQMEHDRQAHRLPTSWQHFELLARRMHVSREELERLVLAHRRGVKEIFGRLFHESEQDEARSTVGARATEAVSTVTGASRAQLMSKPVRRALSELGFSRPRQVAGQLQILREKSYGPFREHALTPDDNLARYLIEAAAAAPNPDLAFSHLTRFVTAVGDRPGYFDMLRGNPHATRLLVHVFGSSAYFAGALIRDPNIFERLLSVGTIEVARTREAIARDLRERLRGIADQAHRFGIVRRFHQEETLRIGLHETGGAASIAETTRQLSLVAEVVIETVMYEVYESLRSYKRRPDSPLPPLDEEIPFAIVAMGKLGGRELGFGSDLDIVFVYEELRQWKLEHTFYARFAQRVIRSLTSASEEGKMYEVDTRLRPSGRQGALVVSLEALDAYHRESAQIWERQALVRARPIAGHGPLLDKIAQLRRRHAFERDVPDDLRAQIAGMRERIAESMQVSGALDVKFSAGGLIDVEFITQFLQLSVCGQDDAWPEGTFAELAREVDPSMFSQNTATALTGLAASGLGEAYGLDLDRLREDYLRLRAVEARLRMSDYTATSTVPDDPHQRAILARRAGHQGADAAHTFSEELRHVMHRIEAAYACVLG